MTSHVLRCVPFSTVAILIGIATLTFAGPPLICHTIDIGEAKSLPMIGWNDKTTGGYDLKRLSADTTSLLDNKTPVIVRMETLRRATILVRHDSQVAKELLTRLHARAVVSDTAGHPDALAWFDDGYLVETYKQWLGQSMNPAAGLDGYGWVKKAIDLTGGDPEMEFAAALITLAGPESARMEHARRAIAGGANDPLLARNLGMQFNQQTVSHLLVSSAAGEVQK